MKQPLYVPLLSPEEFDALNAALRTKEAFTLRRAQIILASARGQKPAQIAAALGCTDQTVRDVIHAFEQRGLAVLKQLPSARTDQQPLFDEPKLEALRDLLHRSPRDFDKPTSLWSLHLVATVCHEQALTTDLVSIETIRNALKRLKVGWKRAKHWITSPDPAYESKKNVCCG